MTPTCIQTPNGPRFIIPSGVHEIAFDRPRAVLVQITAGSAIAVDASLDGKTFVPMRDPLGARVTLGIPGVYRLPICAQFLTINVTGDSVVVQPE
jgi:hypothetical protein